MRLGTNRNLCLRETDTEEAKIGRKQLRTSPESGKTLGDDWRVHETRVHPLVE